MKLEETRAGEPFPKPLAIAIKAFLTPRDRKILIAYYETGANDAELAAIFGPDAVERVAQISDGVGKLFRLFERLERKNETGLVAKEATRC